MDCMQSHSPPRALSGFAMAGLCLLTSLASLRAEDTAFEQLKARFNDDAGVLRLVVLVSPTCPQCVGGADWVETYVLKRYPDLPLRVYTVWYEMYPGDSPDDFPAAQVLLSDKRVTHWWDSTKDVGRWFTAVAPTNLKGEIQWDAYYLYAGDSKWEDGPPTGLLTWGRTILSDRKKLAAKMEELVGPPTAPAIELPVSHSEQQVN